MTLVCANGVKHSMEIASVVIRVRPILVSGIGYRPILASIGGYWYRPILILVSVPIPIVHLPVSTVNAVARTPIVSSL